MINLFRHNNNEQGMMLVSILIIASILIIVGFSIVSFTTSQYTVSNNKVFSANALMVAEAGIEQAIKETNENETFSGHPVEQQFFNNSALLIHYFCIENLIKNY